MLKNFQRKTASTAFIPEIDGMRFFAIITVVIFHLNTAYSKAIHISLEESFNRLNGINHFTELGYWVIRLDLGVKVFFAISGFVLALPFLKNRLFNTDKRIDIKSYFIRRLTRLEPPFIVSLILFFMVHVVLLNENFSEYLNHFLAGLVYGHLFIFGEPNPINPVTWSLETEAQFYLIVPLLFFLVFKFKKNIYRVAVLFVLFLLSMWFKHNYQSNIYLGSSILTYFVNFSIGIFFAYYYLLRGKKDFELKSYLFDVLGLVSTFGLFYFYKPQHHFENIIFFNISIFLFFVSVFKGKLFNYFFTRKLIYTIGGMCYSIYLLHYAFFHLFIKYAARLNFDISYKSNLFIQMLLGIPVVLVISGIFFILIERPCMDQNWPSQLSTWVKKKLN